MTTIVYQDGLMLADTRAYGGNSMPVGMKTKVFRLEDGSLLGVSSCTVGLPAQLFRWMNEGMKSDERPDVDSQFDALLVPGPGRIAGRFNDNLEPSYVEAPYHVTGSGDRYALAALYMGHGMEEALRCACDLDPFSEFPLRGFTHDGQFVEYRTRRALTRALSVC